MPSQSTNVLHEHLSRRDLEFVSAAKLLVPLLRRNAEQADRANRLPAENIDALREAGMLRLGVPSAYGGHSLGVRAATAVLSELGRGCTSTSWVTSLFYGGSVVVNLMSNTMRQRIWGENPDAAVCGALGRPQRAVKVSDGWLIDGRWGWISGIHYADWVGLDITATAEDGSTDRAFAVVPTTDVTIEDSWNMMGMRATASDTAVADRLFVHADQVLSLEEAVSGGCARQGDGEILSRLPFPDGVGVAIVAAVLGAGLGIYERVVAELVNGRPLLGPSGGEPRAIDSPAVQANVADAASLIDSALLQVARAADDADRIARAGDEIDPVVRARLRVDTSQAARHIRTASSLLLDIGGASRFKSSDPIQRLWRDLETATRHPLLNTEVNRIPYGRLLLGLAPN